MHPIQYAAVFLWQIHLFSCIWELQYFLDVSVQRGYKKKGLLISEEFPKIRTKQTYFPSNFHTSAFEIKSITKNRFRHEGLTLRVHSGRRLEVSCKKTVPRTSFLIKLQAVCCGKGVFLWTSWNVLKQIFTGNL